MKLAVVGSKGVVGRALVEYFTSTGNEVLAVDRDTALTLREAAKVADVCFIVTLPIENIASLVAEAARVMRPGTLLIHGTSVEQPKNDPINIRQVTRRKISLCHCHFHFRPEVPLVRTMNGQSITLSLVGQGQAKWKEWFLNQLNPYGAIITWLKPGEHDEVTTVSQLTHMAIALIVSALWKSLPQLVVKSGFALGGPPCRLLIRSVLRTAIGGKVVASIMLNHHASLSILRQIEQIVKTLRTMVENSDTILLEKLLQDVRAILDTDEQRAWDESTAQLTRLEADLRQSSFEFVFPPAQNRIGLLARVIREFDARAVDKTSTIAQVNNDGGCTIRIGVRELTQASLESERAVRAWIKK